MGRAGLCSLRCRATLAGVTSRARCPGQARGRQAARSPFSELQEFVAQCFSSFLLASPSFGPWYEKEWDSVVVGPRLRCIPSDGRCVEWTECPRQHEGKRLAWEIVTSVSSQGSRLSRAPRDPEPAAGTPHSATCRSGKASQLPSRRHLRITRVRSPSLAAASQGFSFPGLICTHLDGTGPSVSRQEEVSATQA